MTFKKLWATLAVFALTFNTVASSAVALAETQDTKPQTEAVTKAESTETQEVAPQEEETSTSSSNKDTSKQENASQSEKALDEKVGQSQKANDSPAPIKPNLVPDTTPAVEEERDEESQTLTSSNGQYMMTLQGDEEATVRSELQKALNSIHTDPALSGMLSAGSAKGKLAYTAQNGRQYVVVLAFEPVQLRGVAGDLYTDHDIPAHFTWVRGAWTGWGSAVSFMRTRDGLPTFCIEPQVAIVDGASYSPTVTPANITRRMKNGINMAMKASQSDAYFLNTQYWLWQELGVTFTSADGYNQDIQNHINNMVTEVDTTPSFNNQTVTLKAGDSITLNDTNGVFQNYQAVVSNTANVTVTRNGNSVTLKANNSSTTGSVIFNYVVNKRANIVYSAAGSQTVIAIGDPDLGDAKLNIKIQKEGTARIKKTDADTGKALAGVTFRFSYDGKTVEQTTDKNGLTDLKLPAGTKVTIEEVKSLDGYVLNKDKKTITIESGKTHTVSYTNKKQTAQINLVKQDAETGDKAQGSATLDGAVYGLYETNGTKVSTVTVKKDKDGKVTGSFKNVQINHDYYIQEITAPTGYNLDKTKYSVRVAYQGQTVEVAVKNQTVKDKVKKGGIELIKLANKDLVNGQLTTNDQPNRLANAEFTITSKTTGKVMTTIKTDKDGRAATGKILPYDTYTITETKAPMGYLPIAPKTFTISEEDQVLSWIFTDEAVESKLKLVKVDAETGKTIPLANTTFKIWDKVKKAYVTMPVPNDDKLTDEFKTNSKGYFVTTGSLMYGINRYEIRELKAPAGYTLATQGVAFSVTEKDHNQVIEIKFPNLAQKGSVKVTKTGETGISATEKDSKYGKYAEITYNQNPLAGVQFKIRAAEDIITKDGTIRLKKGAYVQKAGKDVILTTDELGQASSDPTLYLGKYELVEISAPAGYVISDKPIQFELKYAGQEVQVTSASVKVENNLQEVNIYGYKKQETITGWDKDKATIELENAKNGQVFGLFVGGEGLQLADYSILPADTALGYAVVKDGKVSFTGLKLPNVEATYYLKEIDAGNDHVLDETKYEFTYSPSSNEKVHNIHVFKDGYAENKEIDGKIKRDYIVNKLAYSNVELVKTDNLGNKPLAGVEFNLVRMEDDKEIVLNTYKTDKDGKISVKNLPTGQYKFVETKPLAWYYPNKDDLSFEVSPKTDGQLIKLKAVNERKPMEITTVLATVDGKKEADPTVDNILRDKVHIKGAEAGHTYYIVTEYVNPDTKEVIKHQEDTYVAKSDDETIDVDIAIEKNTMKDGQKGVATHHIYYDKEKTKEVGKEDDLSNTDQTVTWKAPTKLPVTGTQENLVLVVVGVVLVFLSLLYVGMRKKEEVK